MYLYITTLNGYIGSTCNYIYNVNGYIGPPSGIGSVVCVILCEACIKSVLNVIHYHRVELANLHQQIGQALL